MMGFDTENYDCVAIAKELCPLAREMEGYAEEHGRLHDDVVSAFQQSGLYSVNVPDECGGISPTPREQCEAIIDLSKADASAGWCFMVSNGFNWHVGRNFPLNVCNEVLGNIERHVTGTVAPSFIATPKDGGFEVSGESKFNSNVYRSGYKFIIAAVDPGHPIDLAAGETPELRAMLVADADSEVCDDWHVLGLRGTGSNSVKLTNAFIKEEYTTNFVAAVLRDTKEIDSPIYRIPYIPWTGLHTAAVLIGIAERAYDEMVDSAKSKVLLNERLRTQAELPLNQFRVANIATAIRSARAHLLFEADACWPIAVEKGEFSLQEQANMQMAAYDAAKTSVEAVLKIYELVGASAVYNSSPFNKHVRDALAAQQHISVSPHYSLKAISRRLLDLPRESHQLFD